MKPEFDELVFDYLAGKITSSGQQRLEEIIHADPDAARRFAELSLQEYLLVELGEVERGHATPKPGSVRLARTLAEKRERRPFWRYALAASVLIAVSLLWHNQRQFERFPELIRASILAAQGAKMLRNGQELEAQADMRLEAGDIIITPNKALNGAPVTIGYDNEATKILADIDTRLLFLDESKGKWLKLETGQIEVEAAKQPAGLPLIINPGQFNQVEVVGTKFKFMCDKDKSLLQVTEGKVKYGLGELAVLVQPGQESVALAGQAPSPPQILASAGLVQPKTFQQPTPQPSTPVAKNLIAAYRFDKGMMDVIKDVSGVGEPMDLVRGGVSLTDYPDLKPFKSILQSSYVTTGDGRKLCEALRKGPAESRGFTVEIWFTIPGYEVGKPEQEISWFRLLFKNMPSCKIRSRLFEMPYDLPDLSKIGSVIHFGIGTGRGTYEINGISQRNLTYDVQAAEFMARWSSAGKFRFLLLGGLEKKGSADFPMQQVRFQAVNIYGHLLDHEETREAVKLGRAQLVGRD